MTTTKTLKLTKASDFADLHRYHVVVDEIKLGWVCRSYDGTWSAYAKVNGDDVLVVKCVGRGESLRRHAVREVLHAVESRGGVWELNDRFRNEFVDVDPGVLVDALDEV